MCSFYHGLEALEDLLESKLARFIVDDLVKDNSNMSSDPLKDLLDFPASVRFFKGSIDRKDEGGEGCWNACCLGETSGDGVGTDAFDKAGWPLPRLGGIWEGGRGSGEVRLSNNVEECIPRSSRELSGHTFKAGNSVLNVFFGLLSGGSGGCSFGNPGLRC